MALRDVKEYYFKMLGQYFEMKADLADFEQALKDGFITEEQMQAAIDDVDRVKQNYERLSYIMYLLNLPNRKSKQEKYKKIAQYYDITLAKDGQNISNIQKQ